MIDVHCHLNFGKFEKDLDEVIKKAFENGVEKIINVGTSIKESKKVVELAQKYENLYAIAGIHPHDADKLEKGWEEELDRLSKMPKVVAVGETGLDYYEHEIGRMVSPAIQKEVFIKQIKIAHKNKLPLQIHNRLAGSDIVDILTNHKSYLLNPPGMFHCMSGSLEFLKKVLDLGFYIGFDGNITYKGLAKGEDTKLSDLVLNTPIERIVTETDAPFLTPIPHRGSRNEPSYVIIVADSIAKIKSLPKDFVREETIKNTKNLFKL